MGGSSGVRKGYPLQYSGLENSKDCIVHGVTNLWTGLRNFHFQLFRPRNLLPFPNSKYFSQSYNRALNVIVLNGDNIYRSAITAPTYQGSLSISSLKLLTWLIFTGRVDSSHTSFEKTTNPGSPSLLMILNHIQCLTLKHHLCLSGVKVPESIN